MLLKDKYADMNNVEINFKTLNKKRAIIILLLFFIIGFLFYAFNKQEKIVQIREYSIVVTPTDKVAEVGDILELNTYGDEDNISWTLDTSTDTKWQTNTIKAQQQKNFIISKSDINLYICAIATVNEEEYKSLNCVFIADKKTNTIKVKRGKANKNELKIDENTELTFDNSCNFNGWIIKKGAGIFDNKKSGNTKFTLTADGDVIISAKCKKISNHKKTYKPIPKKTPKKRHGIE